MKLKKELLSYIVFGILTTLVNIITYLFFTRIFGINYFISNIFAWIVSVLFAYVTNRIWVFESRNANIIKEISLFFGGRLFSGIVDVGFMYIFIEILSINDFISKIIIQILVIILNYLFSKLIVFKN